MANNNNGDKLSQNVIEFDSATPVSVETSILSTTTLVQARISSSSSVPSSNSNDIHQIFDDDIKSFQLLFRKTITEDLINGNECKRLLDKLRRCSSKCIQNPDSDNSVYLELVSKITQLVDNDHCLSFFNNYLQFGRDNIQLLVSSIKKRQFINILKLCLSFWNLTHSSENICARMVKLEIHLTLIRLLSDLIKIMDYNLLFGDHNNNTLLLLTMSLIGILHNVNRKLQYTRAEFRKEGLVGNLMELTKLTSNNSENNKHDGDNNNTTMKDDTNQQSLMQLRTALLLLLAFLVNEDENSVLNATDKHLVYFIGILKETVNSDIYYSSCHGYHCLEILHGLRHIAAPDCNKRTLISHGILSLIGVILGPPSTSINNKDDEIMAAALELLWSLSFSRDCVLALDTNNCELRKRIEQLANKTSRVNTSNSAIMLAARGTLWNLDSAFHISTTPHSSVASFNSLIRKDSEQNLNQAASDGTAAFNSTSAYSKGHIMISYQHSTQDMMIRIKEGLIDSGYRVWMDVDHMTGSFVDAMAEGIQHASVLVLGLCQAFKNSPHCRQEVKYAYTLGIPLVPVLLEAGFVADGWLGLMCATLIYTEFHQDGPNEFTENMRQLQKQVGNRGRLPNNPTATTNNNSSNGLSQQISNIMTDSLDEKSTTTNSFRQPSCDLMCCSTEEPSPRQNNLLNHVPIQHSIQANQVTSVHSVPSDYPDHSFRSNHSLPYRHRSHVEDKAAPAPSCHYCLLDRQKTSILISDQDHSSALSHLNKMEILGWSVSQTNEWLEAHLKLAGIEQKTTLSQLNGELLLELVDLRRCSPELFFKTMMKYEKLSLIDTLKLSTGLRQLDALPIS